MAANLRDRLGSAVLMGAGLVVVGLAGYGFLALAGHTLGTAEAAAIASFYLIMGIAGPGVFTGFEQETTRSTSAWLVRGGRFGVVARRAALVGAGLLGVVLVVLACFTPLLGDRAFAGQRALVGAVAVGVAGAAAVYLVRGLLAGMQRFSGYAATLAVEGLSRIVLCGAVALVGIQDPGVYALMFALGMVFAALAGLPWLRRPALGEQPVDTDGTPHDTIGTMARGAGLLVGATLGFQTVANVAPVFVTGRLVDDTATAAAFAAAFVLVRIPVLLFVAVQAMLLATLTRAAAAGDRAAIGRTLRTFGLALTVIGAPTVVLAYFLGGWSVQFFFGAEVRLPGSLMALLAVSTLLLMAAQILLPVLVAFGRHRVVTIAWTVGGIVLVGTLLSPLDPVWGATWAQLAACGLVVAIMSVSLKVRDTAPVSA